MSYKPMPIPVMHTLDILKTKFSILAHSSKLNRNVQIVIIPFVLKGHGYYEIYLKTTYTIAFMCEFRVDTYDLYVTIPHVFELYKNKCTMSDCA